MPKSSPPVGVGVGVVVVVGLVECEGMNTSISVFVCVVEGPSYLKLYFLSIISGKILYGIQ